MSNNNLPQEWTDAFKQAGVSTDGWFLGAREIYMQYQTEPLHFEICISGALELWGCSDEPILVSTNGMSDSIQLADRLKRAILNEPDTRVTKLEAIIGELCDALKEALKDQERIATRASYDNDWEAEDRADKRIAATKAALAKARGDNS